MCVCVCVCVCVCAKHDRNNSVRYTTTPVIVSVIQSLCPVSMPNTRRDWSGGCRDGKVQELTRRICSDVAVTLKVV